MDGPWWTTLASDYDGEMQAVVIWIAGGIVIVAVITMAVTYVLADASKHRRDDPK
jgi:hypothetical protein